jgi:hypothetical protein
MGRDSLLGLAFIVTPAQGKAPQTLAMHRELEAAQIHLDSVTLIEYKT